MLPKKRDFSKDVERWFLPVVVVLIGVTAFGLGRLSTQNAPQPHAAQAAPQGGAAQSAAALAAPGAQGGPYVASKSGSKYYLATCAAAGRISDANKVYFQSAAQAQAAGYEPASNCPGL